MRLPRRYIFFIAAMLATCTLSACSSEPDNHGKSDVSNNTEADVIELPDTDVDKDVVPGDSDTNNSEDDVAVDGGNELEYCAPGGAGWAIDSDQDGLTDCEEREMCTDQDNHDTDGDGLSDLEEIQLGTDPCNPDSDGDGLSDYDEIQFGFDPNKESTYDDGILDGDRWIVTACDDPVSEPVEYHKNSIGDWALALPPAFRSYTNLSIAGESAENRHAAAVFDDPANEISGFILSSRPEANQTKPNDLLLAHRSRVATLGSILQDSTGGEFATHNFHKAATSRYLVRSGQARSARAMRDAMLLQMKPATAGEITGFPAASGNAHTEYRMFITAVHRGNQVLTIAAFAPAAKFETHDKIKFRMDDLTNTTSLGGAADKDATRCITFRPGLTTPEVDFYWVLDQSGSMTSHYGRVRAVANEFTSQLMNTPLDYRLGVANMADSTAGKLRNTPGWHTDVDVFLQEIEDYVIRCAGCTGSYGGAEWGLNNATKGIEFMSSNQAPESMRFRPQAKVVTIFMSDEEDEEMQGKQWGSPAANAIMNRHYGFFPGRTTIFSIVGTKSGCGASYGRAYEEVALATGGSHYSLCADDIEETINDIIVSATGQAASHVLADVPVSSSLRVFKDGQWVPRSRINGFDYFANTNSIAFFGSFRPDPESNGAKDHIAVTYRHYKLTSKPGSQN